MARKLPAALKRMQFTKSDGAKCKGSGYSRSGFAKCMGQARRERIGR